MLVLTVIMYIYSHDVWNVTWVVGELDNQYLHVVSSTCTFFCTSFMLCFPTGVRCLDKINCVEILYC